MTALATSPSNDTRIIRARTQVALHKMLDSKRDLPLLDQAIADTMTLLDEVEYLRGEIRRLGGGS